MLTGNTSGVVGVIVVASDGVGYPKIRISVFSICHEKIIKFFWTFFDDISK